MKLKQLCKIKTGKLDANAACENGQYPFFTCAAKESRIDTFAFDDEAILIAGNGLLNVKYYSGKFNAYQRTYVLHEINNELISPKYLFLFMTKYIEKLRDMSIGGVINYIKLGMLADCEISLPPLNEQHRIAAKIEELQSHSRNAKEALQEAKALLGQLRQSVLHAVFTGKLTEEWRKANPDAEPASKLLERIRLERRKKWEESELAKYEAKGKTPPKDWQAKYPEPVQVDTTELPELPKGWCWASLDELSHSIQYGTSEKTSAQGDIPVFRMGNIVDGKLVTNNFKYLPKSSIPPELLLNDGDILFNRTNSIELVGKCAVYRGQEKRTFASYLIRIAPIIVSSELLSEYINSPFGRAWVLNVASQQVGQANVNGTKLKSLAIPFPSIEEQKIVTNTFSQVRSSADSVREIITSGTMQINSLDQSILAKAFRGELVPQDPNDEPASILLERIKVKSKVEKTIQRRRKSSLMLEE